MTRQKVLTAAERLFRDQGFGATTVRKIAAEAGVSSGTVMSVGDKDALLVAIFDIWIDAVHRARADEPATAEPTSAVDGVVALIEPFVRYFMLDVELSREYAAIVVRGVHESEIFRKLAQSLIDEIAGALAGAGLDEAESGRGARVVYFAYLGILMTVAHGTLRESDAIDQLREVIGFVITGGGQQ
ncbi:TetR/AcrR family transcriptional regulator [Saccharopolyspora sp. WRP15-2]|uniref:TetR/AcrR family transcriptional regulator n=1 Tax=Saccharopolyspora oryzae TaxID=2997343 RepID=A0ABT4V4U0_9PSEU|nr:TetR/AcrR family transcriptional regulator [Saccharopolyspora oryzae]MDA3628992.1 TetR/AcrR family transcriptional regulator [Saccharopolyspora oryzae]